MKRRVIEYSLYRGRYAIGYTLGLLVITALILFAAFYTPGGLRVAEQASAVASAQLEFNEFNPATVVNLPYHLMQWLSFKALGITELSIKLPSILLGLATLIGMFYLIKEWYRKNVAMIATIIAATTPVFVFMSQDGAANIYAVAVAFWLLVAATHVSRRHTPRLMWKVIFFILFALNLYSTLGIYLNLAIVTTVIFHPHIRHLVRKLNPNYIALASISSLLILAPMLYSLVTKPAVALQLLGLPEQTPNIFENAKSLFLTYIGVVEPTIPIIQPMLSIGTLMLIAIGVYKFIQVKHTARSYVVWFWVLTIVPLLLVNPTHKSYIFPLAVIMIAMGIATLIAEWYKLFPLNPYARVVGLLPLGIIVIGLVTSNASRYLIGYHYTPDLANRYNQDLRLLNRSLDKIDASTDKPARLIVTEPQLDFYQTVADYNQRFTVSSDTSQATDRYIISRDAWLKMPVERTPHYIATDAKSEAADRFYLYTNQDR